MRKQGTEKLKVQYKQLRREIQRQLRRAYWAYLNTTFELEDADSDQATKSKRFWTYIKHQKSSNVGLSRPATEGRRTPYFGPQRTGWNTQQAVPVGVQRREGYHHHSFQEFHEKCSMPSNNFPTVDKITISVPGVRKLLYNLSAGKAADPDNISPHVLKELAEEVAPILTLIFQSSVDTGLLPADWKDAHVTPVLKKGEQYDPANYRPVSLTSVCCKVLEHILTSTTMDHLEQNNILCSQQHGFRKKRSSETADWKLSTWAANRHPHYGLC